MSGPVVSQTRQELLTETGRTVFFAKNTLNNLAKFLTDGDDPKVTDAAAAREINDAIAGLQFRIEKYFVTDRLGGTPAGGGQSIAIAA